MASRRSQQMFTVDELALFLDASKTSADVLVALVSTDRRRTELSLGRPGPTHDYVVCLLEVLIKATQCGSDATGVIDLLTLVIGSSLFKQELAAVSVSITSDPAGEDATLIFLQNLVEILHQVSVRLPNFFTDAFGLLIILQKRTEEMLLTDTGEQQTDVFALSEHFSDMRDSVMKRMVKYSSEDSQLPCERQAPPEDFRTIPILPRISDIFLSSRGAFLRKNKLRGGYDNLQHYLDVQFRLYREDCISPLREGITQYVQEANAGHSVGRLQDGRLYKNVQIEYSGPSISGEKYKVKLDSKYAEKIKWRKSKRLIYGSLLCLSADNFHTMLFAVVEESEIEELAENHSFSMVLPVAVGEMALSVNGTYVMVESTAYFEAYRHVLLGLQNIAKGELPFEKYIVDCKKVVSPPLYLQDETAMYDLQPILSGDVIYTSTPSHGKYRRNAPVEFGIHSHMSVWPSAEKLHLDQSQFEAFHAALTQEFVLIQGPPGTGKTHVGLLIAKTLLHNRDMWCSSKKENCDNLINRRQEQKRPMLIVCFSNHALDQFLEGIVKFLDVENKGSWKNDIVRVGGRSKSKKNEEFSLKNRRRYHRAPADRAPRLVEIESDLEKTYNNISLINYTLGHLHHTILNLEFLEPVMEKSHIEFFSKAGDVQTYNKPKTNENTPSTNLFKWLQADKKSWLRKARKSHRMPTKEDTPEFVGQTTKEQEMTNDVDDESKQVEDERRIEDHDLKRTFSGEIGLDITESIKEILKPNDQGQTQVDGQLKLLLQREANATCLKLIHGETMSEREIGTLRGSLENLSLELRWRLYRHWVDKYKHRQATEAPKLEQEFSRTVRLYQKVKMAVDAEILAQSTVIAMTTTGAARYQAVLKDIGPRIVIVEEAAEVLEAHIVTALSSRCEHLILIGDHKQLEPKPSVYQLALKYNLSLSMFERMLNNGIENHCLQRQHRMRPDISTLVRDIYPVLEDNENVFLYDNILGVKKDVFFLNHSQPEEYADDIRSYSNRHEARFVSELCRYLLKQGYSGSQITILAPYTGQMLCIREFSGFEGIHTAAIDNFQGEENDIIILSLVRSNKEGRIGFLSRENRMCVALSRAKKGLYVVGNFTLFQAASSRWANVVQKVRNAGQLGSFLPLYCQNHPNAEGIEVKNATDFARSPDGGCTLVCDFRLQCGHVCRQFCHPRDRKHTQYECMAKCHKICSNDHKCQKACHYDNECKCPVKMTKELSCGHEATLECHVKAEDFRCQRKVIRILEKCSHEAKMLCYVDPATFTCHTVVTRILSKCQHEAQMECNQYPMDIKCTELITQTPTECDHSYNVACWDSTNYERRHRCTTLATKIWDCMHSEEMLCYKFKHALCGHNCLKECSAGHTCFKSCHFPHSCHCDVLVETIMPSCGHNQMVMCYKEPSGVNCTEMVIKSLPKCGHSAKMLCSRDPESYTDCQQIVAKIIPNCGHTQYMRCSQSTSLHACMEIVERPHPDCGHLIKQKCSERITRFRQCKEIVEKILLCDHQTKMECCESIFSVSCTVPVTKILPWCGHSNEILCKESQHPVTCHEDVDMVLPTCGHTVKISCDKHRCITEITNESSRLARHHLTEEALIPTCRTLVSKEFPCGHSTTYECNKPEPQVCRVDCSYILPCGHACRGACSKCSKDLFHSVCRCHCQKTLMCGHKCRGTMCGACGPCVAQCANYCPHRACHHPCDRDCILCKKRCALQCPHYKCTRLCFEECNRPRCNRRCQKRLKCTHPCMGFCGDPCPTYCKICEPDRLPEFIDRPFHENMLTVVRLEDCGHEFDASFLDRKFDERSDILGAFVCPKCDLIVRWHPRYISLLKRQWKAAQLVNKSISSCLNARMTDKRFPVLVEGLADVCTYIQKFNSYMYLQKNRPTGPADMGGLCQWSLSTGGQIFTFISDLRSSDVIWSQRVCIINQILAKLSAVWLLFISNSCRYQESSSYSEGEYNDEKDVKECPLQLHVLGDDSESYSYINTEADGRKYDKECQLQLYNPESEVSEARGRENSSDRDDDIRQNCPVADETIYRVCLLIKETQTFTPGDVQTVRDALEPVLKDKTEVNQVLDYPSLVTVGVHRDDWVICPKGHIVPVVRDKTICSKCTSGKPPDISQAQTFGDSANVEKSVDSSESYGKSIANTDSPEQGTLAWDCPMGRVDGSEYRHGRGLGRARGRGWSRGRGRGNMIVNTKMNSQQESGCWDRDIINSMVFINQSRTGQGRDAEKQRCANTVGREYDDSSRRGRGQGRRGRGRRRRDWRDGGRGMAGEREATRSDNAIGRSFSEERETREGDERWGLHHNQFAEGHTHKDSMSSEDHMWSARDTTQSVPVRKRKEHWQATEGAQEMGIEDNTRGTETRGSGEWSISKSGEWSVGRECPGVTSRQQDRGRSVEGETRGQDSQGRRQGRGQRRGREMELGRRRNGGKGTHEVEGPEFVDRFDLPRSGFRRERQMKRSSANVQGGKQIRQMGGDVKNEDHSEGGLGAQRMDTEHDGWGGYIDSKAKGEKVTRRGTTMDGYMKERDRGERGYKGGRGKRSEGTRGRGDDGNLEGTGNGDIGYMEGRGRRYERNVRYRSRWQGKRW